jgi:hypothetical protein
MKVQIEFDVPEEAGIKPSQLSQDDELKAAASTSISRPPDVPRG